MFQRTRPLHPLSLNMMLVCVYSNSRNDVPRVSQRYGTIAAHTRRRASVLVVFVVFCVHMHSFAGLIRRTPPPTFSDTAITDRHSDTTIFQLRAHWVRISWSIGSEKIVRTCAPNMMLYGKPSLYSDENFLLFQSVQRYIKASGRFNYMFFPHIFWSTEASG